MDDTLLGLAAAGIFDLPPVAIGFLVNSAHCAEKRDGKVALSAMYKEKLVFLDTFFGGSFFPICDRFEREKTSADDLVKLVKLCGFGDALAGWCDAVASSKPAVLHLLVSGPLLGRGQELCSSLMKLGQTKFVIWMYAGSFNLRHSSPGDLEALRRLVDGPLDVTVIETTLKPSSWICQPPFPFWRDACPTAWTMEQAGENPASFDVSCNIQGSNLFFEALSSAAGTGVKKGLRWIFQSIVEGCHKESGTEAQAVERLLRELEARSLVTDLTQMVPPNSSSMAKVREALPVSQEDLDEAYTRAKVVADDIAKAGFEHTSAESLNSLTEAARAYADLYKGSRGNFCEAGCSEYFPPGKPCNGPRLDKRGILTSMSSGKLQGGPLADILIAMALLLHLPSVDPQLSQRRVNASSDGWWPLTCCSGNGQQGFTVAQSHLPDATVVLFSLQKSTECERVLSSCFEASVKMTAGTTSALSPLVDATIASIVRGGIMLLRQSSSAPWGTRGLSARKPATRG